MVRIGLYKGKDDSDSSTGNLGWRRQIAVEASPESIRAAIGADGASLEKEIGNIGAYVDATQMTPIE